MKKIVIILLFAGSSLMAASQPKVKTDASGNFYYVSVQDTTKYQAIATGKTFTNEKGEKYQVYQGAKGGLYVLYTSKKNRKYIISGAIFTLVVLIAFSLTVWTLDYTHIVLILISPFGVLFGVFHRFYDKEMEE